MTHLNVGDWIHLDLRCFSCNGDLVMLGSDGRGMVRLHYCSLECSRTTPLSGEMVVAFKMVLHELGERGYLDLVPPIAVADAMLEHHPHRTKRYADHSTPDGLQSYQWRSMRIEQLESLLV